MEQLGFFFTVSFISPLDHAVTQYMAVPQLNKANFICCYLTLYSSAGFAEMGPLPLWFDKRILIWRNEQEFNVSRQK